MKIILDTISKAKEFVHLCNEFNGHIDVRQKKTSVDGKSVLGVLALALSEPMEVTFVGEEKEEKIFWENIRVL